MTGLLLQRVVVAALLAVSFLLANPFSSTHDSAALAATTEDTEAGSGKKEADSKKDIQQKPKGADKSNSADGEKTSVTTSKLPPLDLGTGATAKEQAKTEDVLAEGVTATASSKSDEAENGQALPSQETSGDALDPKKLWTPNSGRFLLKDRQAGLALASSADSEDKGDGKPPKPTRPKATKPAATKPVSKPTPKPVEQTPVQKKTDETPVLGLPSEETSPELATAGSANSLDLPEFLADTDSPPDTAGEEPSPVSSPGIEPNANGSPLVFSLNDNQAEVTEQAGEDRPVGVTRPITTNAVKPTLGKNNVLGSSEGLGESVVGVSPWRGVSVFLLCLALIFAAYWASQKFKGKLGGLPGRTLSVIETIGIGAGRQIIIIEMNGDALILGVTPNSINLLDKVPLVTLNSGYSATVDGIISREGSALPGQWESRPRFDSAIAAPTVAPPILGGTYGSPGQAKTSVAELRATRQSPAGAGLFAQVAEPPEPRNPKEELIGRFRSQLSRFGK